MGNGLAPVLRITFVAHLSTVCAELVSQSALIGRQGGVRLVAINRKTLQRLFCAGFGDLTSAIHASDGLFKSTAEISGKARHSYWT
jgi:hypothetical protein